MLDRATEIFDIVAKETDSIVLFHSLSGKDSIALLDMAYPRFKRVVCVFMYVVKDLEHIMRYYRWAKQKYPNIEFMQVPHYGLCQYIKDGTWGHVQNPRQKLWSFGDIGNFVREKLGIEWLCAGFKQSDSLNRRLMLRSYKDGKEAICWQSKKFYPLSTYKNADILEYIQKNHLKTPEAYGNEYQSAGQDVSDEAYLRFLRDKYPNDLKKVLSEFPMLQIRVN